MRLCINRITLIIAHRLSTVRHAHQILVLEDGRVAEQGNHESLLKLGGIYARMWSMQKLEDDRKEETLTKTAEGMAEHKSEES